MRHFYTCKVDGCGFESPFLSVPSWLAPVIGEDYFKRCPHHPTIPMAEAWANDEVGSKT